MEDRIMKKLYSLFLTVSVLFIASCDHVGLGESVDMEGPTVKIETPGFMENVSATFNVSGTVYDDKEVAYLSVTCSGIEYKHEGSAWKVKKSESGDWEEFSGGIWKSSGEKTFSWGLEGISVTEGDDQYVIKVSAADNAGNMSADSVAQTTILYDSEPPKVTISSPKIKYTALEDIKAQFDSLDDYKNFSILDQFINGKFSISGNQVETFTLQALSLEIRKPDGASVWTSPRYVTSSSYIKEDSDVLTPNLRSWTIDIPDLSQSEYGITKKTYLQIVTSSVDSAGNEENDKVHGYICYWPEADIPWTEVTSVSTQGSPKTCYPSSGLSGYSYDDDGLGKITAAIYQDDALVTQSVVFDYTESDESPTYLSWEIDAPATAGVTYRLTVTTQDKNGVQGEEVTGWFTVKDITYPDVSVKSPSQTEPLFGDSEGNFTFDIQAVDDSGVRKLACVYLVNQTDQINYLDYSYSGWSVTKSGEDSNKNKFWILSPADTGERNEYKQKVYVSTLSLNLFSDLGIDGETRKLSGQHFIFYVEDSNGNKSVTDYAIQGDSSAPEVSFSKVVLNSTEYSLSEIPTLRGSVGSEDKIYFTGTWSDDSLAAWGDVSKLDFTVSSNENQFTVTKNTDGTWQTEPVNAINVCTSSVIPLSASVTDYAGNTGIAKASFKVPDVDPALTSITSSNPDGTFVTGKTITIILKFNKKVTFTGGSPTLTLNNKATATYTKGKGSQNIEFTYTVKEGEDVDPLDVTSINGLGTVSVVSEGTEITIPSKLDDVSNLKDNKNIAVVTKKPEITSLTLSDDGTSLEIKFSSAVTKNSGDLTLEQSTVTNVPPVLTSSEYKKLWAKNSNFADYYTLGTNGADSSFNPDLTQKYVLNYDTDSNDQTLLGIYKDSGATKVTLGVKSSAITLSSDKKTMTASLTGSFALPCKGVAYNVSIPANFVSNAAGLYNEAKTDSVTYKGIEPPVIRVNKGKATYSNYKAQQPLTSEFKIDCETPGVTLKYSYTHTTTTATTFGTKSDGSGIENLKQGTSTTDSPIENGSKTIGSDDYKTGEIYKITAIAKESPSTKDEDGVIAYESAYRTVIAVSNLGYDNVIETLKSGTSAQDVGIWIRGGDVTQGGNTTSSFPLSWNTTDYTKTALLTKDSGGIWYYVTWDVNATCYFAFIAGSIDSQSVSTTSPQGPAKYIYAQNSWVSFKADYGIAPGGYILLDANQYASGANVRFEPDDNNERIKTRGE